MSGGGFFSKFCVCRPQRPEDTGVLVPPQSVSTSAAETKKGKKSFKSAYGKKLREVPMVPSPPSDEATPTTSNRKSVDKREQHDSNGGDPTSTRLLKLVHVKNSPSCFIDELEASSANDSAAEAAGGAIDGRRKSYPSFHNTHPVQENVKAKLELFENAFSPVSQLESTETTEDLTENSDTDSFRKVRPTPSWDEPVVDCDNDPWEPAYALWYRKGLLKWLPKSVMAEHEVEIATAAKVLISEDAVASIPAALSDDGIDDLATVKPSTESPEKSFLVEKLTPADGNVDDAAAMLMKYRSKPATACANCGKDTSSTIELVRCGQCKQEVYCSIFCRGNDRYNHATRCRALLVDVSKAEPTTSAKNISAAFAIEPEEEKKEDQKDSFQHKSQSVRLESSGPKVSERSAVRRNMASGMNPIARTPEKSSPFGGIVYSDAVQMSSSRSSSLQKSKEVPIVSCFSDDSAPESPKRLTYGFV